jgi:hypothetical protein
MKPSDSTLPCKRPRRDSETVSFLRYSRENPIGGADGERIMAWISTAINHRRPARRWPGWLALVPIAAISSLVVAGPGEAARDHATRDHATRDHATGVYRPGGMAPGDAERALGHDPRALAGCLLAGDIARAGPAGANPGSRRAELSRLFEIIGTSATGRAVLARARRHGVHVCIDSETDLLAYYFAGRHMAGVRAGLPQGGKIAFLAHELAHVPQHPTYSDNRYYPPADLILLRRVREAAAEAIAIRIAWELREGGEGAAWDAKLASAYTDMARRFAMAVTDAGGGSGGGSGGGADLLEPTRAAFDRWFEAPWRRNAYDQMTLAHLARISEDRLGLVPPRYALSHDFLAAIAWIEGRNFLTETGTQSLTGPTYGGRMSEDNARLLARFNAHVGVSSGSLRAAPVAVLNPLAAHSG